MRKMRILFTAVISVLLLGEVVGQATFNKRIVPQAPNGGGLPIIQLPDTNGSATSTASYLAAFPNPAKDNITFKWDLPDGMEIARIAIVDLQGRAIETIRIEGQQGKLEWDTSGLNDGVYIYSIELPDGILATSRLAIIK